MRELYGEMREGSAPRWDDDDDDGEVIEERGERGGKRGRGRKKREGLKSEKDKDRKG